MIRSAFMLYFRKEKDPFSTVNVSQNIEIHTIDYL